MNKNIIEIPEQGSHLEEDSTGVDTIKGNFYKNLYQYKNFQNSPPIFSQGEGGDDGSVGLGSLMESDCIVSLVEDYKVSAKTNEANELNQAIKVNILVSQGPVEEDDSNSSDYSNRFLNQKKEREENEGGEDPKATDKENKEKKTKKGRKPKNSTELARHNKNSDDNIRRKIKSNFLESLRKFLNDNIKIYGGLSNGEVLLKIDPKEISEKTGKFCVRSSNGDFVDFKSKTVEEIFSSKISLKYKNYEESYNRKIIQKIFDKGEDTILIKLLKMTILEYLEIFKGSKVVSGFENMIKLEDVLKEFRKKGNDEKYCDKAKAVCKKILAFTEKDRKEKPIFKKKDRKVKFILKKDEK